MNEMFQLEGTTLRIILPQELDHPMADLIRKGTEMIAGRTYIRTIVFDFRRQSLWTVQASGF